MKNKFRHTTLLCITAILTTFSLFAVILFDANHKGHEADCHEQNCPICLVLQIIHNTEKIGQSQTAASVEFTNLIFINVIILSAFILIPTTLVKQKVKLVI